METQYSGESLDRETHREKLNSAGKVYIYRERDSIQRDTQYSGESIYREKLNTVGKVYIGRDSIQRET